MSVRSHIRGLLGPWCGRRSRFYSDAPTCEVCRALGGTPAPVALTRSERAGVAARARRWALTLDGVALRPESERMRHYMRRRRAREAA